MMTGIRQVTFEGTPSGKPACNPLAGPVQNLGQTSTCAICTGRADTSVGESDATSRIEETAPREPDLKRELWEILSWSALDGDPGDPIPMDHKTLTFAEWFNGLTPRQHKRLGIVMRRIGRNSQAHFWHDYFALEPAHCNRVLNITQVV